LLKIKLLHLLKRRKEQLCRIFMVIKLLKYLVIVKMTSFSICCCLMCLKFAYLFSGNLSLCLSISQLSVSCLYLCLSLDSVSCLRLCLSLNSLSLVSLSMSISQLSLSLLSLSVSISQLSTLCLLSL
jgi:hypothetical protein